MSQGDNICKSVDGYYLSSISFFLLTSIFSYVFVFQSLPQTKVKIILKKEFNLIFF